MKNVNVTTLLLLSICI